MGKGLLGKRVVKVRTLTAEELKGEYWDERAEVRALVFDDGSIVYASMDEEGNGPGVLVGKLGDDAFYV